MRFAKKKKVDNFLRRMGLKKFHQAGFSQTNLYFTFWPHLPLAFSNDGLICPLRSPIQQQPLSNAARNMGGLWSVEHGMIKYTRIHINYVKN